MSTVTDTITTCPNFQGLLVDHFDTCPASRRPESPLFSWLYSAINRSNLRNIINPVPGRKRTVTLVYDQPVSTSDVQDVPSCDRICDASTPRGDLNAEFTIECTDGKYVEEQIRLSDWNESCRSDGNIIASKIMNMIDGLMPVLYEKVAAAMGPLLGGWSADVTNSWINTDDFLEVATEIASSDNPNFQALQRLSAAIMQSGYCRERALIGGIDLFMYQQVMRAGCCTEFGVDLLTMIARHGEATGYDRYVATEFGNDVSLLIQAGSVQLLTYNAVTPLINNIGGLVDLDMTYRNYFEAIIQDPATGFPLDISVKSDCGVVDIVITGTVKPVGLPLDMYPEGHPNEGVTFASGVQVVNPA